MCLADRFYCYWSVQKNHPLSKFKFQLSWHHGSRIMNVWCHKTGDSLFPPSDAGTQDAVCVSWTDLFMLLATVVRRDSSAAYPSVSAALGRCWQAFAGIQKFLFVCVQVTELFTVLCTAYIWHLRFHKLYFKDNFCRFQLQCIETVLVSLGRPRYFIFNKVQFNLGAKQLRTASYLQWQTSQEASATHVLSVCTYPAQLLTPPEIYRFLIYLWSWNFSTSRLLKLSRTDWD